jgi:hypothetical protein
MEVKDYGAYAGRCNDLTADPLVQFRCVTKHPGSDRGMVYARAPFCHKLFQITQRQAVSYIPPDTEHDHVILEVASSEQRWPVLLHRFTLPDSAVCHYDRSPVSLSAY